ncbi:MAG: hypothetical protein LBJ00_03110, partial [Planctomycetaceae bacterium]|nr:hypothetical protein [Planctomycetaceae bacterium]
MNNRFTLLRFPNALRCRFTAASGILKQLEYNWAKRRTNIAKRRTTFAVTIQSFSGDLFGLSNTFFMTFVTFFACLHAEFKTEAILAN